MRDQELTDRRDRKNTQGTGASIGDGAVLCCGLLAHINRTECHQRRGHASPVRGIPLPLVMDHPTRPVTVDREVLNGPVLTWGVVVVAHGAASSKAWTRAASAMNAACKSLSTTPFNRSPVTMTDVASCVPV